MGTRGASGVRRRIRGVAVAVAAVGLLAVAGCSDDDGDRAERDDAPTTTVASGGSTTTAPDEAKDGGTSGGTLGRYADYETVNYADPAHWVCRPDVEDDPCDGDLDATIVEADGTLTVEPFEPAADPPIDCFYVYPTISRDETTFSDWEPSDEEEGYVTVQQAARLRSVCRLYAPVYRQVTLTALLGRMTGEEPADIDQGDPFADVLDAFRTYMAEDNGGRGVVLIGHSQGSGMLNRLIAEEVDPNEDVREKLVGAYLAGSAVAVPDGEVVGGDFAHVPLCTEEAETGCVVTWATFRSTSPPPPESRFGRPREGDGRAGCVNPAAVEGGPAELHAYFPASAEASILSSLGAGGAEGASWLDPSVGTVETPFVRLPGLVTGECVTEGDFDYLSVTVDADPADPRADDIAGDLTPDWGLHLIDVSVVMGNIVDHVAAQAETYAG